MQTGHPHPHVEVSGVCAIATNDAAAIDGGMLTVEMGVRHSWLLVS
jgi:hypothetical protein